MYVTSACTVCLCSSILDKIQAAVSDGVTIGHPCCAVQDCKNPLESHSKRFCLHHKQQEEKCAVVGCSKAACIGHQTCDEPNHRSLEIVRNKTNSAMFQLRRRLEKSRATIRSPEDKQSSDNILDDDEIVIEVDGDLEETCSGKPESGNQKIRAYFGRRKTHNEQFMMRPCGVILSRCTFFGSEAISGVYVSAQFVSIVFMC